MVCIKATGKNRQKNPPDMAQNVIHAVTGRPIRSERMAIFLSYCVVRYSLATYASCPLYIMTAHLSS